MGCGASAGPDAGKASVVDISVRPPQNPSHDENDPFKLHHRMHRPDEIMEIGQEEGMEVQVSSPMWNNFFRDVNENGHTLLRSQSDRVTRHPVRNMPEAQHEQYARIKVLEPPGVTYEPELTAAAQRLCECLHIRQKYIDIAPHIEAKTAATIPKEELKQKKVKILADFDGDSALGFREGKRIVWDPFTVKPPSTDKSLSIHFENGVLFARQNDRLVGGESALAPLEEFCKDYVTILKTMNDRVCGTFCNSRLQELELKFELYQHHNSSREAQLQKQKGGRDWYQVRKVDTHIHHAACFTQQQFMTFIKTKMLHEMDTVVHEEGGKKYTLEQVFSSLGVNEMGDITAETLCTNASMGANGQHDTFGRFDLFNNKYNPFGDKRLRDIFLKYDNYIQGRYLAELTKEVMHAYAQSKFTLAEWRISIYGRSRDEWAKLGRWFRVNSIQCAQIRWVIQVPRLYYLYRKSGQIKSFAELLDNVFRPVFEATADPEGNEDIFYLLNQVIGFDSVDDESVSTQSTLKVYPTAEEWVNEDNPPYTYWMYHMYACIRSLNALRRHRGLSTFTFRPHCGEAGAVSHLCSGFMLADLICHGVQLKENSVLQYLYYLAQVPLAVSPLSNDILFIPLASSPFPSFFRRGLNVSLSTDDPLIIHMTEAALVEEYITAARVFRLSMTDLCEISRNSVLQSGFERLFKDWWVGGVNDSADVKMSKSNVPKIRIMFRADCLKSEKYFIRKLAAPLSFDQTPSTIESSPDSDS